MVAWIKGTSSVFGVSLGIKFIARSVHHFVSRGCAGLILDWSSADRAGGDLQTVVCHGGQTVALVYMCVYCSGIISQFFAPELWSHSKHSNCMLCGLQFSL